MKRLFITLGLITCSMQAHSQEDIVYISPEKMMYDLNEEATCIAAASYLKVEREQVHRANYTSLVAEYQVPNEVRDNILELANQQYMHFINRAIKRYQEDMLPSMLLSAYTHRCEFMNGFEARSQFDAAPPEI
ncbi:hypothetical protein [Vibrio sp. WXL210]|uniref:hypothetical protein n=1 Tax=Vibrio sp. WXL210 TaxID=3450709 RepID=UPI003EC5D40C